MHEYSHLVSQEHTFFAGALDMEKDLDLFVCIFFYALP